MVAVRRDFEARANLLCWTEVWTREVEMIPRVEQLPRMELPFLEMGRWAEGETVRHVICGLVNFAN